MSPYDWDQTTPGAPSDNPLEVQVIGSSVLIRNARIPEGPVLEFDRSTWREFVKAVRAGEFDIS